jgi:hypothetical protein
MKKHNRSLAYFYSIAAFMVVGGIFLGLYFLKLSCLKMREEEHQAEMQEMAMSDVEESPEVENESAGEPYQIFIDKNGREPKNRYEYRVWLKQNFTTDWEYWYERYRQYRRYQDGFDPGSGFFTYKGHEKAH